MIARHFATPDFDPVNHEPRQLIVAANGLFYAHVTRTILAVLRVVGFSAPPDAAPGAGGFWSARTSALLDWLGLRDLDERFELRHRLPAALKERLLAFHRAAWARHRTESLALLYVNPETGEYRVEPPLQRAAPARVETLPDARPLPGLVRFGTSHSHPCDAFHSGVDHDDEAHGDGLHLVFGNLDRAAPDIIATLVVRGRRQPLRLDEVFEPDREMAAWLERVQVAVGPRRAQEVEHARH